MVQLSMGPRQIGFIILPCIALATILLLVTGNPSGYLPSFLASHENSASSQSSSVNNNNSPSIISADVEASMAKVAEINSGLNEAAGLGKVDVKESAPAAALVDDLPKALKAFQVIDNLTEHTATVIFVHGLMAQSWTWAGFCVGQHHKIPHARFVLPSSYQVPVGSWGGVMKDGWFDIKNFSRVADPSLDDEERMLDAVQVVEYLIKVEVEQMGIPEERIVVAGISQGGVITLLTGLTTKRKLAGLLCLSGWIPLGHKIKSMINPLAEKLAVFWAHGTADSQIPYSLALTGMRMLEKYLDMPLLDEKVPFGRPGIKFDTYKMDHQLIDPEANAAGDWLALAIPPLEETAKPDSMVF